MQGFIRRPILRLTLIYPDTGLHGIPAHRGYNQSLMRLRNPVSEVPPLPLTEPRPLRMVLSEVVQQGLRQLQRLHHRGNQTGSQLWRQGRSLVHQVATGGGRGLVQLTTPVASWAVAVHKFAASPELTKVLHQQLKETERTPEMTPENLPESGFEAQMIAALRTVNAALQELKQDMNTGFEQAEQERRTLGQQADAGFKQAEQERRTLGQRADAGFKQAEQERRTLGQRADAGFKQAEQERRTLGQRADAGFEQAEQERRTLGQRADAGFKQAEQERRTLGQQADAGFKQAEQKSKHRHDAALAETRRLAHRIDRRLDRIVDITEMGLSLERSVMQEIKQCIYALPQEIDVTLVWNDRMPGDQWAAVAQQLGVSVTTSNALKWGDLIMALTSEDGPAVLVVGEISSQMDRSRVDKVCHARAILQAAGHATVGTVWCHAISPGIRARCIAEQLLVRQLQRDQKGALRWVADAAQADLPTVLIHALAESKQRLDRS